MRGCAGAGKSITGAPIHQCSRQRHLMHNRWTQLSWDRKDAVVAWVSLIWQGFDGRTHGELSRLDVRGPDEEEAHLQKKLRSDKLTVSSYTAAMNWGRRLICNRQRSCCRLLRFLDRRRCGRGRWEEGYLNSPVSKSEKNNEVKKRGND